MQTLSHCSWYSSFLHYNMLLRIIWLATHRHSPFNCHRDLNMIGLTLIYIMLPVWILVLSSSGSPPLLTCASNLRQCACPYSWNVRQRELEGCWLTIYGYRLASAPFLLFPLQNVDRTQEKKRIDMHVGTMEYASNYKLLVVSILLFIPVAWSFQRKSRREVASICCPWITKAATKAASIKAVSMLNEMLVSWDLKYGFNKRLCFTFTQYLSLSSLMHTPCKLGLHPERRRGLHGFQIQDKGKPSSLSEEGWDEGYWSLAGTRSWISWQGVRREWHTRYTLHKLDSRLFFL